jgi:hypothetical protein
MSFNNLGRIGWYKEGNSCVTFQLGDNATDWDNDDYKSQSEALNQVNTDLPILLTVGGHHVLAKGSNNLLPEEIQRFVGTNRLLPELIEKQIRIAFGHGLHVYQLVKDGNKIVRKWDTETLIDEWLENWMDLGINEDANTVAIKILRDFYYFEDFWIQWKMKVGRGTRYSLPVAGLEHIENKRPRFASSKPINPLIYDPEDRDFDKVIVGNWAAGSQRFKLFKRFRMNTALSHPNCISYHKNASVGQIYGLNNFYLGIRAYLKATNDNPESINAFLENSLSASHHVIIPWEWVEMIEKKLQQYCEKNKELQDAGKSLLTPKGLNIGTSYHVGLRDKYIGIEMKQLTKILTGRRNEGKMYTSYSMPSADGKGSVQFKIELVDRKYKEFIDTLINYDKRADEVITAAKGMDSSLSNISKDGIISKSGSDLFYNYLIYIHNLTIAEKICTEPFNWALKLNFPKSYAKGYRIGFYMEVPARQEEVAPADRLENNLSSSTQQINNLIKDLTAANAKQLEQIREELKQLRR